MPTAGSTNDTPVRIPRLGERGDIPAHELPLDALTICQNMLRDNRGRLVMRPGWQPLTTSINTRPMGIQTWLSGTLTVVGTQTGWLHYVGSGWQDITGIPLTGNLRNDVQYAVFPQSGTYLLIGVNGINQPKKWDPATPAYVDIPAAPCAPIDVTVCANRVIMLSLPNVIDISEFNNVDHAQNSTLWPGFTAIMADAGDIMILIERLTRTSFSIMGEQSQWIGRAQSGRFPFRFDIVDEQPGPLSIDALIRDGFVQYYLAMDGNVYRFDGIRCTRVGNAMQRWVLDNLNFDNRFMVCSVFKENFRTAFFFFPSATSTACDLGVYYNVDSGEMGRFKTVNAPIAVAKPFWKVASLTIDELDQFSSTIDGLDAFFPTIDSMGGQAQMTELLGDDTGLIHIWGKGRADNANAIEGIWELPLINPGGTNVNYRPAQFETFFEKTGAVTPIEVSLGTTNTLKQPYTYQIAETIDASIDERDKQLIDMQKESIDLDRRFITIRHRTNVTTGGVEWLMGNLRGSPVEIT